MYLLNLRFFSNLICSLNLPWTRGFTPPPSTCCVLDIIGVSPCFGWPIWICMSFFWTYDFSQLSLVPLNIPWTRGFLPPSSTCRVFDVIGVSPCFSLPIWICMYFWTHLFSQPKPKTLHTILSAGGCIPQDAESQILCSSVSPSVLWPTYSQSQIRCPRLRQTPYRSPRSAPVLCRSRMPQYYVEVETIPCGLQMN